MTQDEFRLMANLSPQAAQRWYAAISDAMAEYEIDTPARIAAFIAQTGHETMSFVYTREIWGPTAAQRGYEPPSPKAAMLGNTEAGDGHRFLGRGLIQITGRANYSKCAAALAVDLLGNPDLLAQETLAARSAAWWWQAHGCNTLADSGDFKALTRRINGGLTGLDDRLRRWKLAKSHLTSA
ncbi:glycoside hydrolase family 19 protein [Massilia sp. BJB1822]|uniref:glycoside hydrolase family 19 protein n=1 Tax=Massilia sp. BJB1822 TaxID=2744470 RepID=UPI001593E10A|nr:glycoside hydrolase family 19 protein [Massilia sp. BJB1822]NVE01097.1 glycoside hydrolase family 19 protein [Massilia sp. BJB1822]